MITDPGLDRSPFGLTTMGRSGQWISRICLGTMTFGSQLSEKESHKLLDYAFSSGIVFFDTANAYSGGEAERILGNWAEKHRNDIVISTKIRYQVGNSRFSVGLSKRTIKQELEKSLIRLRTDWVDILYLHQPDSRTSVEETMEAVDDLIHQGKVHYLGVSNFAAWQIMKLEQVSLMHHKCRPVIVQPMYNLLVRSIETELLPCCRDLGLSVFVYNPLAAGILTGKHDMKSGIVKGGRFEVLPYYQDRYWKKEYFDAVVQLRKIADRAGRSLIGLAYRFILDRQDIDGIVIGASSMKQLMENLGSIGEELEEEITEQCDRVWLRLKGPSPAYNR